MSADVVAIDDWNEAVKVLAELRLRYGVAHQMLVEARNVHPAFVDVEIDRRLKSRVREPLKNT